MEIGNLGDEVTQGHSRVIANLAQLKLDTTADSASANVPAPHNSVARLVYKVSNAIGVYWSTYNPDSRTIAGADGPGNSDELTTTTLGLCDQCENLQDVLLAPLRESSFQRGSLDYGDDIVDVMGALIVQNRSTCRLCAFLGQSLDRANLIFGISGTAYHYCIRRFSSARRFHGGYFRQVDSESTALRPELLLDVPFLRLVIHGSAYKKQIRGSLAWKDIFFLDAGRGENQGSKFGVNQVQPLVDFANLQHHIKYCQDHHGPRCNGVRQAAPQSLKFNFVDCQASLSSQTLTIVPGSSTTSFVALSYVWGPQPAGTDSANRALHNLPATILDAIHATERLGFRFLWIDRFCMPQDDETAKRIAIQNMDVIYSCAEVTIIETAGDRDSHGIVGVRSRRRQRQGSVALESNVLIYSSDHPLASIGSSKWSTRGWTYQEAVLSKRRIFFTTDEFVFDCQGMFAQESMRIPLDMLHMADKTSFIPGVRLRLEPILPEVAYSGGRSSSPMCDYWDHIASITRRQLTNQSDGLNAFLGIATHFWKAAETIRHFQGLPYSSGDFTAEFKSFCLSLLWSHMQDDLSDVQWRDGFPTWSWVGWSGRVRPLYDSDIDPGSDRDPAKAKEALDRLESSFVPSVTSIRIQARSGAMETFGDLLHLIDDDHAAWGPRIDIDCSMLIPKEDDIEAIAAPDVMARMFRSLKSSTFSLSIDTSSSRLATLVAEGDLACFLLGRTVGTTSSATIYYMLVAGVRGLVNGSGKANVNAVRLGTMTLTVPSGAQPPLFIDSILSLV